MALQAASVVPRPEDHCATWLDGAVAPRAEARGLFALVRSDAASVEDVRELIGLSPRTEDALRRYMRAHPEDARGIEKVLRFRERVRAEFDRLVEVRESDASPKPQNEATQNVEHSRENDHHDWSPQQETYQT